MFRLSYAVRDKTTHYFVTAGKVPWQDDMVASGKE